MNNYKSSIHLELQSYKYPAQPVEYVTKTWNDIAEIIDQLDGGGKVLKKNIKEYDQYIGELAGLTDKKKMEAIYRRVQEDFTWNGYTGVYGGQQGLRDLLDNGFGNNAIINLVLCNLLNEAGLDAKTIVYKTRGSGFLNLSYPTLYDLNYLIVYLEFGNNAYYLDGSDENLAPGELPSRAINYSGVLLDQKEAIKVTFENPNYEKTMSMITLEVNDLQLSGTQAIRHSNYAAYLIRSKYQNEKELKKSCGSENFKCDNIEVSSFDDLNKPISIKSEVTINQSVRKIDGKLFLDPIGFVTDLQVPFVKESREYSIFYDSKISENIIFKIKIPDGYKIESLPEELNIATPEQYVNASISTKEMNGVK